MIPMILLCLFTAMIALTIVVVILWLSLREQAKAMAHAQLLATERYRTTRTRLHSLEAWRSDLDDGVGIDPAAAKGLHAQLERLNQTLDSVTEGGNTIRTVGPTGL